MTTLAPPLLALAADPAWMAMDATARGFHIQLLLMAAQHRCAGVLDPRDAILRRYLGLRPAPKTAPPSEIASATQRAKVRKEGADQRRAVDWTRGAAANLAVLLGPWWEACTETAGALCESDLDRWQEHLWMTRWRPMVLDAWRVIDETLIQQQPHLEKYRGYHYSAVAAGWAHLVEDPKTQTEKALPDGRVAGLHKTSRARKKTELGLPRGVADETPNTLEKQDADAEEGRMPEMEQDLQRWHHQSAVLGRWRLPAESQVRKTLWDVGVGCLVAEEGAPAEKAKARALLGKLIKQYGEEAVARAVAQLSMRAVAVADAGAFLTGLLRNQEEGTPAEQKARSTRSRVAL